MSKKNQIYLVSFIMYLVVGLSGYIAKLSNFWMVLIINVLLCAYTLLNVFSKEENVFKKTMVEWISVCAFTLLETIVVVGAEVFNFSFVGAFRYFNYVVQILGLLFAMYAIVKFVINNTDYYQLIKSKFSKKEVKHEIVVANENNEVATKVEEVIEEEVVVEEKEDTLDDIDIIGEDNTETEVIGIELKKEETIETPYMEEEI